MGKHAAPATEQLSQVEISRHVGRLVRDLAEAKPNLFEETNELAIQLAAGLGMAPPDLEPHEEESYGTPHDYNVILGLQLVAILAPGFADHMDSVIGNW